MSLISPSYLALTRGFGAKRKDGNDPFTKLLLHMDGTDGSTTFTDSAVGGVGHTVTAAGNAQIDTAQSKFGGASGLFDGTGDWLTIPDSDDFDFSGGVWTVDFWVRFATTGTELSLWSQWVDNNNKIICSKDAADKITFQYFDATVQEVVLQRAAAVVADTWYHIAIVEDGNDWFLFVDGAIAEQETNTNRMPNLAATFVIGAGDNAQFEDPLNGWLDEFRVSKRARWKQAFSPYDHAYS